MRHIFFIFSIVFLNLKIISTIIKKKIGKVIEIFNFHKSNIIHFFVIIQKKKKASKFLSSYYVILLSSDIEKNTTLKRDFFFFFVVQRLRPKITKNGRCR